MGKPDGPAKVVRTWGVAAVSVVEPPHQLVEPPLGSRIDFKRRAGFGGEHPEAAFGLVRWGAHFNESELVKPVERPENQRATIATDRKITAAIASSASANLSEPQQGGALIRGERGTHGSEPEKNAMPAAIAIPSDRTSATPGRSSGNEAALSMTNRYRDQMIIWPPYYLKSVARCVAP